MIEVFYPPCDGTNRGHQTPDVCLSSSITPQNKRAIADNQDRETVPWHTCFARYVSAGNPHKQVSQQPGGRRAAASMVVLQDGMPASLSNMSRAHANILKEVVLPQLCYAYLICLFGLSYSDMEPWMPSC